MKPKALILTGYGINCDEETRYAFEYAGADAVIIHINDLIAAPKRLADFNIFVFPGGFSYGDDTGSGKALSNRIRSNLFDEILEFTNRETLMLGICNGFQVMANLGIVPSGKPGLSTAALVNNKSYRYRCAWVNLKVTSGCPSVFLHGIDMLHIPVAHGEGNFYASPETLTDIETKKLAALRYVRQDGSAANGEFPANPNGSLNDIAALCDATGRIMGMMPHPERGMFFSQRDDWPLLREHFRRAGQEIPEESDGMKIFRNAVKFFK